MRLKSLILIVTVAAFGALFAPGLVSAAGVVEEAQLRGSNEPSGGDTNGKGTAELLANKKKRKVCWAITYKNIEQPFAAHIHRGFEGEDGPIVVPLAEDPFPSGANACVKRVKRGLIREMIKHPGDFYVNVHNEEFPGGAIRGQIEIPSGG